MSAWGGVELGRTSVADIFWPANGILIAFLLRLERCYWVSYLAGSVAANIFAHVYFGFSPAQLALFSASDTIEVLPAALFLSTANAQKPDLDRLPVLGRFVLAGVLLAPLVSAAMVELSLAIWSKPAGFVSMTNWFVGDALGIQS